MTTIQLDADCIDQLRLDADKDSLHDKTR